jgi:hypothetical protein
MSTGEPDHFVPHGTCTECGNDDAAWRDTLCLDCRMATDQGTAFGTWSDRTSQLLYHDAMPALLSGIDREGRTLDLGGGNGLSRYWFEDVTTVDNDQRKQPDVLADMLGYAPTNVTYDRVLLRYVLHYLNDTEVRDLLTNIRRYHRGDLVVVQFVNDTDTLEAKYANSVNETKWFRTEWHLLTLLTQRWEVHQRIAVDYDVDPEFYRNRLGHPNPTGHPETVVAYLMRPR